MNIQQYYEQAAMASLNAALVAFIPSILLLIYAIFITQAYHLILLVAPFLIYSFFCYQKFLLNQNRAKAVKLSSEIKAFSVEDLFDQTELLVAFMPAPSLRLLLFTPNGVKVGEIRDQSFSVIRWFLPYFMDRLLVKKYGLYDCEDQPVAFYHHFHDRLEVELLNQRGSTILYKSSTGKKKEFVYENRCITIENKGSQDFTFLSSDGKKVAQIQTGWMPLEWGERFLNLNTPILYLDKYCSRKEKLQLLSLLTSIYAYEDH
ncbi:hypothetical protein JMM81_16955 [Bacillus sp. V3B]|uniref:hypothetical protein n=1 Tax=Bacillus sp. V3B TaxID=2804915 RepID=UPI00210AEA23|nr:hypothetical protein [Bacillus sp. V3B]MCQ6276604.1 hypothetical protein [Bacillus sp. V3B]